MNFKFSGVYRSILKTCFKLSFNKFAKRDYTQPSFPNPPLFVERERERERERTVEEEEESSRPCVECEVPRELLLHRSELIPPPVLGFE